MIRSKPTHRLRNGLLPLAAALGAACALLSGCVVDQAHEVHLYREVLDDNRPKPGSFDPRESLTLERAMALANANNEQLASQGENYLQTLIAKNRAFSSFLPTVSFQPNFTVEDAPKGATAAGAPGAPGTNAASVAATQGGFVQDGGILRRFEAPVVGEFNFAYRNVPLLKEADLLVVEQRQMLLDAQATVLLNVAQTYFQVEIATRQLAFITHSLTLQQARVHELEGRYRVRLALSLDVSQARANESGTRVQQLHAANDVANARRMLALLIGVPAVDGPLVDGTFQVPRLDSVDHSVSQALALRQDYLAATNAVKAAHQAVKAAVAEYYPSVSLNVAGYLYREDYANASKWNAILSANLPIFTAGQIRSDVRLAWSHLRQAALAQSYLKREIDQGVRTAYANLDTSGAVLSQLQQEVNAASQAFDQSRQMEKNGLAIPLDVMVAQDTLLSAQLQYASEEFSRNVYYLDLVRSTGQLTPDTARHLIWTTIPQGAE